MISLLNNITIGNKLKIYTASGLVTGSVIDIIEAGTIPTIDKVKLYYSIGEDFKYFKAFHKSMPIDRLIVLKDNGSYFILPKVSEVDRYLLDIQLEA